MSLPNPSTALSEDTDSCLKIDRFPSSGPFSKPLGLEPQRAWLQQRWHNEVSRLGCVPWPEEHARDIGRCQEGEDGRKCSSSSTELQAGLWLSSRGYEDAEVLLEGWKNTLLVNSVDHVYAESGQNTQVSRWESVSPVVFLCHPSHASPCRACATQKQNPHGLAMWERLLLQTFKHSLPWCRS